MEVPGIGRANYSFTCSDVPSDNTPFSNTSASGSCGRLLRRGPFISSGRISKAYNIGAVRQERRKAHVSWWDRFGARLRFRLRRSSCLIFAHTSVFDSRILRASSSSEKAFSAARAPGFGAVGQARNHHCQPYSGITTSSQTSRCLGCRFPEISWTANVKVRR
jgi:hypothetical protein